jgi:hypothetical protein
LIQENGYDATAFVCLIPWWLGDFLERGPFRSAAAGGNRNDRRNYLPAAPATPAAVESTNNSIGCVARANHKSAAE